MSFHINGYGNDTSIKITITSVVFCFIFLLFIAPIMFERFSTPESRLSDEFLTFLKSQVNECKFRNATRIDAWKKAGEPNAEFFTELQCNTTAINTFLSTHSKIAEPKK